jgi:predicted RNA-binding Zn ribbon-like protein
MVLYITEMADGRRTFDALRFDAGSLSLNLVATVGRRFATPVDRLSSVERLRDWLRGVGLDVNPEWTDDDLDRLRSLREDLHVLFRHAVSQGPLPAAVLARVNAAAAHSPPRLRATGDGFALARRTGVRALDPVIALVAADAVRILAGNERAQLRTCEADDCSMLYLSQGQRPRRWCSSATCGNRSRVAAHRARSREAPAP